MSSSLYRRTWSEEGGVPGGVPPEPPSVPSAPLSEAARTSPQAPAGIEPPRWCVTVPGYGYVTVYDRNQKGDVWSRCGQRSTEQKRRREAASLCKALNEGRLRPLPLLPVDGPRC